MPYKLNKLATMFLVILCASLGLNIYLVLKTNALQEKISNFIPAAQKIESENKLLRDWTIEQQDKIDFLETTAKATADSTPTIPFQLQTSAAEMDSSFQQPSESNFRDLNKFRPR